MSRPIDPVDIKVAIRDGQLEVFVANGNVYIKDAVTGDCVKIWEDRSLNEAVERIKDLPSAQPERMRAKWIATTSLQEGQITWRDYKCSNCSYHRGKPMNFCEVCGAKMER